MKDEEGVRPFVWEDLGSLRDDKTPRSASRRRGQAVNSARIEDAIRARLRPAGYDLTFRDREVFINDERFGDDLRPRLSRGQDARKLLSDDNVFGALANWWLPSLIKEQGRKHLRPLGRAKVWFKVNPGSPGYQVNRGRETVAVVTATTFRTAAGEEIRGPFWAPGSHWEQADRLLRPVAKRPRPTPSKVPPPAVASEADAEPSSKSSQSRGASMPPSAVARPSLAAPPMRTADRRRWPADAPQALTAVAAVASELLRSHRVRADDFLVEIDCGEGRFVDLQPVKRRSGGRLELPVSVRTPRGDLLAFVYLKSPNAVLAIDLVACDTGLHLHELWTLALQVAAARYCGQPVDPDSPGSEPLGFTPDAATKRRLRHWVAGHVVRLPEGQRAGDDAVKAAEEVDIELPDGHTWRRGHARGERGAFDEDVALRYSWRPPSAG